MMTSIRLILVCLCALVSALTVAAENPEVTTVRQDDSWLWSTGDFKPDRGLTDEHSFYGTPPASGYSG
jgi:hypothetical protein